MTDTAAYKQLLSNFHWEVIPMKSLDEQRQYLPAGEPISVTCSPVKGIDETVRLSEEFAAAGHRVTPHFAARMVTSDADLKDWLGRIEQAGITSLFCIAGDGEEPLGPYADSLELIDAVLEHGSFLSTVGFGSYPDGHALIDADKLTEALHTKQTMITAAGKQGWTSTQMCFDPQKIGAWMDQVRADGFTLPFYLGVAGAIDRKKLMTMGARLGIGTSLSFLKKNRTSVLKLLGGSYDADEIIAELAPSADERTIAAIHGFTFNQVESTVKWRNAMLTHLG